MSLYITNEWESWLIGLPFIPQFFCCVIVLGSIALIVAYLANRLVFHLLHIRSCLPADNEIEIKQYNNIYVNKSHEKNDGNEVEHDFHII